MKNTVSFKKEKPSQKALPQGMLIFILGTFMCVVFLCSASYAWFTAAEKSAENVITSSFFALNIGVRDENNAIVPVTANDDGTHTCTFTNAGIYTVTLTMTEDTTASKGYCELTINSTQKKQTESISRNPDNGKNPFTFTIEVEAGTVVSFESKWGISAADEKIANGDTFTFGGESVNP